MRSQQERVFFGSHLGYEQDGRFGETIKGLKQSVASGDVPAKDVQKLLKTSRKGFTITDTETHAEQSLLFSKTWDALKADLVESIRQSTPTDGLKSAEAQGDTILVTILLNRSSCRGCGLALSLALIEFWTELGKALNEKPGEGAYWEQVRKKYGSRVRFVARFPTIYEFSKEKGIDFANLKEVLASMTSVGWEVAPVKTHIQGGKESHEQLNAVLKALGALPSDKDLAFYRSGGGRKRGAPLGAPRVQPPASPDRVDQVNLRAFLNAIAPGWNVAFAHGAGGVAPQGAGDGYMAHQIAAEHQAVAAPLFVEPETEDRGVAARGLRVSRNGGGRALCFVFAIVMGITGQTEDEVREMVFYIAEQARAGGGWISVDSPVAARVVGIIEGIYGAVDVVVVQHGADDMMVSGRVENTGARTVVIRQTIGHYDAYVP